MGHELSTREAAAGLFEDGHGFEYVAGKLDLARNTARKWLYTYRAFGKEGLFVTSHKKYSQELKVAAAKDVVEDGMTKAEAMARHGIASLTALERWCRAYREGGPDALEPKPKGRPRKPEEPVFASREEELEARVRELELELEIQKRINALADGIGQRSHRR